MSIIKASDGEKLSTTVPLYQLDIIDISSKLSNTMPINCEYSMKHILIKQSLAGDYLQLTSRRMSLLFYVNCNFLLSTKIKIFNSFFFKILYFLIQMTSKTFEYCSPYQKEKIVKTSTVKINYY